MTTRLHTRRAPRVGTLTLPGHDEPIAIGAVPLRVGRGTSCEINIPDASVSMLHAELVADAFGIRLRDLGSRNGTYVAGQRVGEIWLAEPGMVSFGEVEAAFGTTELRTSRQPGRASFGEAVAVSTAMRTLFERLARVAATDLTVLIEGETGTGKDVLARALHANGPRREAPFVVVDCASIPASLAESALFGHERGAFTGAVQARPSPFVEADGGTVFLDELGELPLELQPKLLRVIETRTVMPVGGRKSQGFDVRIVAATRRDIAREVNAERFRSDLYFRLAQFRVRVPPLRERPEDVLPILQGVLREAGHPDALDRVPTESLERALRHDFPGNVRELRNAALVALFLAGDGPIELGEQLVNGLGDPRWTGPYHEARQAALHRFEQAYLAALVAAPNASFSSMARDAGLARQNLRQLLRKHGLYRDE